MVRRVPARLGWPPVDSRSGWATAPPVARPMGDEAYRVFASADDAMAFLRQQAAAEQPGSAPVRALPTAKRIRLSYRPIRRS